MCGYGALHRTKEDAMVASFKLHKWIPTAACGAYFYAEDPSSYSIQYFGATLSLPVLAAATFTATLGIADPFWHPSNMKMFRNAQK